MLVSGTRSIAYASLDYAQPALAACGGQIKNAKNAYVKALEYNKNHAKALQQLGWLHYKDEDDFRSAIEYLKQASEIGEVLTVA